MANGPDRFWKREVSLEEIQSQRRLFVRHEVVGRIVSEWEIWLHPGGAGHGLYCGEFIAVFCGVLTCARQKSLSTTLAVHNGAYAEIQAYSRRSRRENIWRCRTIGDQRGAGGSRWLRACRLRSLDGRRNVRRRWYRMRPSGLMFVKDATRRGVLVIALARTLRVRWRWLGSLALWRRFSHGDRDVAAALRAP